MADWRGHSYSCNAYKEADKAQRDAKEDLERYLHYHERYEIHAQSQEFEGKLRASAQSKMEVVADDTSTSATLSEMQFVADAAEQLIQCRRTLKYSYIHGCTQLCIESKEGPTRHSIVRC